MKYEAIPNSKDDEKNALIVALLNKVLDMRDDVVMLVLKRLMTSGLVWHGGMNLLGKEDA